jgi:hypothetical protein
VEIAQISGDAEAVRRLVALRLSADSTSGYAWYLRWHRALALGESARRAFWTDSQRIDPSTWGHIQAFMTWTGVGTKDLLRVTELDTRSVEAGHPGEISSAHALALLNGGRPADARRLLNLDDTSTADLRDRVLNALYWGADTTAAAEAARRLAPIAARIARHDQAGRAEIWATCSLGSWYGAHGDYGYVEAALAKLRAASNAGIFTHDSEPARRDGGAYQTLALCSALLEATRATALHLPDARAKLNQADVAARTYILSGPLAANLVIARLAEAQGDLALGLRAVRRRGSGFIASFPWYLSTFLHEEGRLSALTGDTAGAIRAYQHYLALRPNPEPGVKPQVDRVREELTRLVGEHPRR